MVSKFIILSSGRSGSTMLESILQQHENITCNDELLRTNDLPLWDMGIPISGFKCLNQHIHPSTSNTRGKLFLKELQQDMSIKIIYLRRVNEVARAISMILTKNIFKWHRWKGDEFEIPKVYIDPNALVREILTTRQVELFVRNITQGHQWLETTYETLCDNYDNTVRSAFCFLGADPIVVPPKTDKFIRNKLEDQIDNWDEVLRVLSETGLDDAIGVSCYRL